MSETVPMNQRVLPRTIELIDKIAALTFRGKGDVIDWAISQAYERILAEQRSPSGQEALKKLELRPKK